MSEPVTSPWCGPAAPETDTRPWWRRLASRLRRGPYERSRVTFNGYMLILVTLALGGAAYNSGNNLLFLALSFLLACLILNGLLAWANFGGMAWRLHTLNRIHTGDTGTLKVELHNHRRWLPATALFVEVLLPGEEASPRRLPVPRSLLPGESLTLTTSLRPPRRGEWKISVHRAGSAFPFGFIRKTVLGESELTLLVRPARCLFQSIRVPARSFGSELKPSLRPGSSGDLLGLRGYQRGDPLRAVHWKASARAGRLLIRELSQEQSPRLGLLLDFSDGLWTDPILFEKMLSFAAALAERWMQQGTLAAVAWDGRICPIRRPAELEGFLDFLATVQSHSRPPVTTRGFTHLATAQLRPLPRGRIGAFVHEQIIAIAQS